MSDISEDLPVLRLDDATITVGVHGDSLSFEQPEVYNDYDGRMELVLLLGIDKMRKLHEFIGEAIENFDKKDK